MWINNRASVCFLLPQRVTHSHRCLPTNTSTWRAPKKLCGCTQPILGHLCWNGVSCTFEILIVKPPLESDLLRVSLLDPVPVSSGYGAVCMWKCRWVMASMQMMQRLPLSLIEVNCAIHFSRSISMHLTLVHYFGTQFNLEPHCPIINAPGVLQLYPKAHIVCLWECQQVC